MMAGKIRTVMPSIRVKCLDCRGGSRKAVRDCDDTDCALHSYRMRKRPPKGTVALRALKAIRAKCLDCGLGQPGEVRLCPVADCSLWPYRFGKKPTPKTTGLARVSETEGREVGVGSTYIELALKQRASS